MTRYFGVKCKKSGEPIAISEVDVFDITKLSVNMLPLDPFECPACGEKHIYVRKDGFEFEAENIIHPLVKQN